MLHICSSIIQGMNNRPVKDLAPQRQSHPIMWINNTQGWHDEGKSWVTDFKKKLPQILCNLQPIQGKRKKKNLRVSNSTHSRYFTICALPTTEHYPHSKLLNQNMLKLHTFVCFSPPNHSSICALLPARNRLLQAFLW